LIPAVRNSDPMQTRPSNRISGSLRRARESITRDGMALTPEFILRLTVMHFNARRDPGQLKHEMRAMSDTERCK
jgi:hypothetical protein